MERDRKKVGAPDSGSIDCKSSFRAFLEELRHIRSINITGGAPALLKSLLYICRQITTQPSNIAHLTLKTELLCFPFDEHKEWSPGYGNVQFSHRPCRFVRVGIREVLVNTTSWKYSFQIRGRLLFQPASFPRLIVLIIELLIKSCLLVEPIPQHVERMRDIRKHDASVRQ